MTITIAIDGPAGSGKSSAAKAVARLLGLDYIDTGAMYRALTWWMLDRGIDIDDPQEVSRFARTPRIDIDWDVVTPAVHVDGIDVTQQIREQKVSGAVSRVSAVPAIRERLVELQRGMVESATAAGRGVVMEGRDIGTVVLPAATVKVFLTADVDVRAQRRAAEDAARAPEGEGDRLQQALANLQHRDATDSTREVSPLVMAHDAVRIDATHLSLDEVVETIAALATEHRG